MEVGCLGAERVTRIPVGPAVLVFGRGPRYRSEAPHLRAQRVVEDLGPDVRSLVWCRQVHGRRVLPVDTGHRRRISCLGPGDGLVTAVRGVGLVIWTADCVPVLLAGGGAVAAVHAGWRGAAAGILVAALDRLRSDCGVSPAELTVHLGPAVGSCHNPVGTEVVQALAAHGVSPHLWLSDDQVDLRAFLTAQARCLGVARVVTSSECTACQDDLASHRRDGGEAGRQLSIVYLAGEQHPLS